eukprot:31355-Pelagococcus_subviridis.AAC.4
MQRRDARRGRRRRRRRRRVRRRGRRGADGDADGDARGGSEHHDDERARRSGAPLFTRRRERCFFRASPAAT